MHPPERPIPSSARLALGLGVVTALAAASADAQTRPPSMAGRSTVYAPHGVIATSQPLATAAGLAVLQKGGNAIDAAVTAAAVLNLVEPHMTGIGGDMFALLWSAREKRLVALNASGRSGSLMTREELVKRGRTSVPLFGAEPITVPGALSGWAALLQRYGTISLAQALAPAIRLADEGFPVSPVIAGQWAERVELLARDEGARATYLIDGARAPRPGEWFRNPDLAASFRKVAQGGPAVLYGGALGSRIVDRVRQLGGFLTLEDLANQKIEWVQPISTSFRGKTVWELPPNNQGVAVLEMLKILEPYDLKALGHNSAAYLHLLIEAKKLAYADLARWVGDPAAMTVDVKRLVSPGFIAARRALLDPRKAAERVDPGDAATAGETIYLAAADSAGNMVSFINSNFEEFGSGVVVPGTGFVLHDRGAGFTMQPGLPNTVGPGKRPFHTLIPAS
jgi:gamma-glutamyltranspeptidase/glutathione hydrolase